MSAPTKFNLWWYQENFKVNQESQVLETTRTGRRSKSKWSNLVSSDVEYSAMDQILQYGSIAWQDPNSRMAGALIGRGGEARRVPTKVDPSIIKLICSILHEDFNSYPFSRIKASKVHGGLTEQEFAEGYILLDQNLVFNLKQVGISTTNDLLMIRDISRVDPNDSMSLIDSAKLKLNVYKSTILAKSKITIGSFLALKSIISQAESEGVIIEIKQNSKIKAKIADLMEAFTQVSGANLLEDILGGIISPMLTEQRFSFGKGSFKELDVCMELVRAAAETKHTKIIYEFTSRFKANPEEITDPKGSSHCYAKQFREQRAAFLQEKGVTIKNFLLTSNQDAVEHLFQWALDYPTPDCKDRHGKDFMTVISDYFGITSVDWPSTFRSIKNALNPNSPDYLNRHIVISGMVSGESQPINLHIGSKISYSTLSDAAIDTFLSFIPNAPTVGLTSDIFRNYLLCKHT